MAARYEDVDGASLDAYITRATIALAIYPDLDDPRNFDVMHGRACARWARGDNPKPVLADLRSAALCLRGQGDVRLYKMEPHRLKSRRLIPLHLACLHADPVALEGMGAEYALPLMAFYADAAPHEVERELKVLSGYFSARRLAHANDIIGLAAATYAAALASMMRGDEKEAAASLRVLMMEADRLTEAPPAAARRYLHQCAAIGALLGGRTDEVVEHLVALTPYAEGERDRAMLADPEAVRTTGVGAPDLAIPALVGLAMLMNHDLKIRPLKATAPELHGLCKAVVAAWAEVE